MKIRSVTAQNFGSYDGVTVDFESDDLTLIEGPTGSGKSTIFDLVPWALFGRTAKNGLADEVVSWPGDKTTTVVCYLDRMVVTRIRGKKNDLYFRLTHTSDSEEVRGKDINDTQKMINSALNMNLDTFLAGCYYHEFSQTAQFFTTTPKNRRQICEQIVDLSFPIQLKEKLSEELKGLKTRTEKHQHEISSLHTTLDYLERNQEKELTKVDDWNEEHSREIKGLEDVCLQFETSRERKIGLLEEKISKGGTCPTCGSTTNHDHASAYKAQLLVEKEAPNPFVKQLEKSKKQVNPHSGITKDYSDKINTILGELSDNDRVLAKLKADIGNNELLTDLTSELRAVLVGNVIESIQDTTNSFLAEYFEGEFRIALEITGEDKLEVNITKDGNVAAFTQLSKGQRQLLKLCFSISVMQAVNNGGTSLDTLFLDEVFEGMDDNFKVKALRLLEHLTHKYQGVYFIEHSEMVKGMVTNKWEISIDNGVSYICRH